MVVHSSSEAPRLPEASAFERAAGTTSHPKQSATKVDHGLAVETRLQKLADPNACDPKTAAATATSAAASMAAPSTACVAAAAAPSCATASSAAASVAAPSESGSNPYATCSGHFLVEDKESRQADVRDFLLSEDYRCGGVAIPPVAIEADAPPTSDKAPATPNAVTALLRPFALEIGFECDISDLSGWPRTSDWGRMSGVQTNRGQFSPSQLAAQAFLRLTRCLCVSRVLF